jgi:hypothetical protein
MFRGKEWIQKGRIDYGDGSVDRGLWYEEEYDGDEFSDYLRRDENFEKNKKVN